MPSSTDPIRRLKRRRAAQRFVAGAMVIACATWAIVPVQLPPAPNVDLPAVQPNAEGEPELRLVGIDPAAFNVRLWNPPPGPPPAEPQKKVVERPRPPQLQLVAVIEESGELRAALYDPEQQKLVILASGEQVGRFRISRITRELVEITDGDRAHELRLKEERS